MATSIPPLLLPAPPAAALALSADLGRLIAAEIERGGGRVSFARYMELALFAPGLGYYMAGARKLGRDGDFVTAPGISPLFGRTLARQLQQLAASGLDEILEIASEKLWEGQCVVFEEEHALLYPDPHLSEEQDV